MGLLEWLFGVCFSQTEVTQKALKAPIKPQKEAQTSRSLSTKGFQKLPSSEEQPQPGGSCVGSTAFPLGKICISLGLTVALAGNSEPQE